MPDSSVTLPELGAAVSRGDRIVEVLRHSILEGLLAPGQPLVEREIAQSLGVSKTPVREALKLLASSGLVTRHANQRMSVRVIDEAVVNDSYTARIGVEPFAIRMAVEARGARPWPEARQALDAAREHLVAGRIAEHGLANRRFHKVLYTAAANPFILDFLNNLLDLGALIATTGWRRGGADADELEEHERILDAAEAGDAELASHILSEHIRSAAVAHLAALDDRAKP